MRDMTATIPHQLPRAEAKRRIQEHVGIVRQQYGSFQETWTGDRLDFSLKAMKQSIRGHLTVDDDAVHVTVSLPWILQMLASTVKPRLEQEGRLILSQEGAECAG